VRGELFTGVSAVFVYKSARWTSYQAEKTPVRGEFLISWFSLEFRLFTSLKAHCYRAERTPVRGELLTSCFFTGVSYVYVYKPDVLSAVTNLHAARLTLGLMDALHGESYRGVSLELRLFSSKTPHNLTPELLISWFSLDFRMFLSWVSSKKTHLLTAVTNLHAARLTLGLMDALHVESAILVGHSAGCPVAAQVISPALIRFHCM
jgi:hypothetical protein